MAFRQSGGLRFVVDPLMLLYTERREVSMAEKLKAGVVGLGILGWQHMSFLNEQPEVETIAAADLVSEIAQKAEVEFGVRTYQDYRDMLKKEKLDLVVIATPDPFHREPVVDAVDSGVPVVVQEKPMATTVADAESMLDAAEKAGTKLFINFANRGSVMDLATHYVIQQGLLGEIVYGDAHLDDNICVPTTMWGGRTKEWTSGSSTAHFLLSHVVDFLRWTLSPAEVTEVYAVSHNGVLGYTPDLYDAFLAFTSGARFRVKAEWIRHIDDLVEFGFCFSGTEGSLDYVKRPRFLETEGWRANLKKTITVDELKTHHDVLFDRGINIKALVHRPEAVAGALSAGEPEMKTALEAIGMPMDWWRIARAFVDAALEDTLTPSSWDQYGPLPTGEDGLKQTQVVCAIVESANTGKVVSL